MHSMMLPSAVAFTVLQLLATLTMRGAHGGGCGNWGDSAECAKGSNSDTLKRTRAPINSASSLQYSMFIAMQYYGPPEPLSTYHTIASAAKRLAPAPFYISVCCDHNDTSGGGGK